MAGESTGARAVLLYNQQHENIVHHRQNETAKDIRSMTRSLCEEIPPCMFSRKNSKMKRSEEQRR